MAKPVIYGLAATFHGEYELSPGVYERVQRGAFSKYLRENGDVVSLFNHDPNHVAGRTLAGTLLLRESSAGLEYEIYQNDTSAFRDMLEQVAAGHLLGASFGFAAIRDHWFQEDSKVIRLLQELELRDAGPVTFPAYVDTTAKVRNYTPQRSATPTRTALPDYDEVLQRIRAKRAEREGTPLGRHVSVADMDIRLMELQSRTAPRMTVAQADARLRRMLIPARN